MAVTFIPSKLTKAAPTGMIQAHQNHYIDSIWVWGSSLGKLSTLKIELMSDDAQTLLVQENQIPTTVLLLERGHANKDFSYPVIRNAVDHLGQHIPDTYLPWCTLADGSRRAMFRATIGGVIPDDASVNIVFYLVDKHYLG